MGLYPVMSCVCIDLILYFVISNHEAIVEHLGLITAKLCLDDGFYIRFIRALICSPIFSHDSNIWALVKSDLEVLLYFLDVGLWL